MQRRENNNLSIYKGGRAQAFTLLETVLAVSIILLALVPLLHLHVRCIQTCEIAMRLSKATVLADEQLAKLTADSNLSTGTYRGRIDDERQDIVYEWSAVVEDLPENYLEPLSVAGLRRVQLTLDWVDGYKKREVTLESIVLLKGIQEKIVNVLY